MSERSTEIVASITGWLIVAIPAAAVLFFAAWITTYKLGFIGGVFYGVALALWVGLLFWLWKRG